MEVRAGIEPAYADLQSAASPLCHRTAGAGLGRENPRKSVVLQPRPYLAGLSEIIQIDPSLAGLLSQNCPKGSGC